MTDRKVLGLSTGLASACLALVACGGDVSKDNLNSGGGPGSGGSGLSSSNGGDPGRPSGGQSPNAGGNQEGSGGAESGGAGPSGGDSSGGVPSGGVSSGGSLVLGETTEVELAALPGERQEHAVVALLGEVYVLGGYVPAVTPSMLAYDPEQDSWREVADFPRPLNHPNAVVIDDKLYVCGFYAGTSLTGPATGESYVYDPEQDAWEQKQDLPDGTARAGSCVAALGTDLYVFGGGSDGEPSDLVSVYDTLGDSWQELPPLPESREHCSAFASNGKLYIGGGRTHTIPEFRFSTLEFDPETKAYTEKTPIPTPRGGPAGAVLYGRLFLMGGEGADNEAGVFPEVEAYDPITDSWQEFPPLLHPRHGYGAAVIDGRIYLAGGATREGGGASDIVTMLYFAE